MDRGLSAQPVSSSTVEAQKPTAVSGSDNTRRSVSVIICAYSDDRWADLLAAVQSVEEQTMPPAEVIVVIDHNPALLQRLAASVTGICAVENQQQRGLSGARNTGIALASGDVIAFLDDDAMAAPDWLERLDAAYADPRVLGTGGSINPAWATGRPRWFPEEFDWVVGCTYRGLPDHRAALRNLIGANMSFRRTVFQAVGHFRPEIGRVGSRPVGCEETELCIRARQHWQHHFFVFEPAARVDHRVPAARATWGYFRSRTYSEGLSKAQIARLIGARDGLASEWRYTLLTLPRAVVSNLLSVVRSGDPAGFARAAAIIAGLALTTTGYFFGKLSTPRTEQAQTVADPKGADIA